MEGNQPSSLLRVTAPIAVDGRGRGHERAAGDEEDDERGARINDAGGDGEDLVGTLGDGEHAAGDKGDDREDDGAGDGHERIGQNDVALGIAHLTADFRQCQAAAEGEEQQTDGAHDAGGAVRDEAVWVRVVFHIDARQAEGDEADEGDEHDDVHDRLHTGRHLGAEQVDGEEHGEQDHRHDARIDRGDEGVQIIAEGQREERHRELAQEPAHGVERSDFAVDESGIVVRAARGRDRGAHDEVREQTEAEDDGREQVADAGAAAGHADGHAGHGEDAGADDAADAKGIAFK